MLEQYFDLWGSRCYFFSSELEKNYMWTKKKQKAISGLTYDWRQFSRLGGKYILSAVKIKNPENSGLNFLNAFEHPDSAWKIWLYEPL